VICEIVEGLTKGIRGCEPQIEPVIRDLRAAGYSASWPLLDSRHVQLPHQRRLCWTWGLFRAESPPLAETAAPKTLQSLMHPRPVPLDDLFSGEPCEDGRELNAREMEVVQAAKRRKTQSGSGSQDWVIDVSKS
jgi:site-specific DNA-cytosine methylase